MPAWINPAASGHRRPSASRERRQGTRSEPNRPQRVAVRTGLGSSADDRHDEPTCERRCRLSPRRLNALPIKRRREAGAGAAIGLDAGWRQESCRPEALSWLDGAAGKGVGKAPAPLAGVTCQSRRCPPSLPRRVVTAASRWTARRSGAAEIRGTLAAHRLAWACQE